MNHKKSKRYSSWIGLINHNSFNYAWESGWKK